MVWWLACGALARGDEVRVAVAANFRATGEALAREFEVASGHTVTLSSGSTGSLFAQLEQGAGFDVFLAADARRPAALGARALERFTYARGRLALIGPALTDPAAGEQALRGSFTHLALANPRTAPYGAAAREALQALGLWAAVEPRVVYGESVAQAYQFVHAGGAELALVGWAQALAADAPHWRVPAALHAPIRQDAARLSERPAAIAFCAFLRSPAAQARIAAAGYATDDDDDAAGTRGDAAGTRDDAAGTRGDATTPGAVVGAGSSGAGSVWVTVRVTLSLAATSTAVLLLLGTPLAWWLARGRSVWRVPVSALVALPLVLPPTVLGFYLLVFLGPAGPLGAVWEGLGGPRLVFSFGGLVVGSVVYSLPFVVQPLRTSFEAIDASLLEAAATLRASWADRWRSVVFPLARPGFVTAAVLGFAHTVGEFGVVLMLGGNIPGRTQVLSVAIFDHVEQLELGRAHALAGGMLAFAFVALLVVYACNRRFERVGP